MTQINPLAISDNVNTWHAERTRWTKYYEESLHNNLVRAKEYVAKYHRQPAEVKRHVASLLTLLQQAQKRPSLHPIALEVITQLHPWPSQWGLWRDWEQALRFAIDVCLHFGWQTRQATFLSNLAQILFYTGSLEEAAQIGRKAVVLGEQSHTPLAIAHGGTVILATMVVGGHIEEAKGLLHDLLQQVQSSPEDAPGWANAFAMLRLEEVDLLRRQGELHQAVEEASGIITQLEARNDAEPNLLAHAYRDRSLTSRIMGEYTTAATDLHHAETLFQQEGDTFAQALVLSSLGLLYWNTGDLVLAERSIRQGIRLIEELNARWHLIHEIGNLGLVYLFQGDLHQAMHCFENQRQMGIQFGEIKESKRAIGNRAVARYHMGEYELALADMKEELAFFGGQQYRAYVGSTLVYLSLCYKALGQEEKALVYAEEATALGKETGSLALQVMTLRCMAEFMPPSLKLEYLQRALNLAQGKRKFDEAACLLSLAGVTDEPVAQCALWERGCQLLQTMHATQWVQGRLPQQPPQLPLLY